ncbi:F-box/WD repeat-containing protein 8-like isoform X2 [Mercenaria mercenaria]|uniref:F-box/WD repeat-containing protein 8-like isoform X2 n=1 Tax=Mercenaria mercenaria TaxID=6596 RepID=UPI00234F0E45|nr:F-box/WD repeat-containing protein 8-like isoform X2 [Mercenaria mercenaria]
MTDGEQLEIFRKQWRKELEPDKTKEKSFQNSENGRAPTCTNLETCKDQCKNEKYRNKQHKFSSRIVDSNEKTKCCEGSANENYNMKNCRVSLVRKNNKRLKLSKLEDIFVEKAYGEVPNERLLDKLISDIDEITEIPFFDISLPREVAVKIFQYLSIKDLCSCAQVSKSWCSLAEDELLWCRLCHRLGHEKIFTTQEKDNWKQIVRHNVERQRTLISNWKNRTGKLLPLEYVKGKILSAVHSHGDIVVAGYTSGEVKLWNLSDGGSCIFQPSSTSLILDVNADGLQQNIVNQVYTSEDITVAAYSQGNVDIWSLHLGTQPFQTYTPTTGNQYSPSISLSADGTAIAASYGPYIDVLHREEKEEEFNLMQHLDCGNTINNMMLYNGDCDIPAVIFSKAFSVHLYQPQLLGTSHDSHVTECMTEIHNMIGAPVDIVDYKTDQSVLGVALGSYSGLMDGYKVKVYDITTARLLQTLEGHTWKITCMNLQDSPPHQLVTGSGDRKIRIYDFRSSQPEQILIGNSFRVSCIQMDNWKVVSGSDDGFLRVWDRRMKAKLWELHNRFRGTLNVYNFLEDLTTKDVPEICLSSYDQPDASKYNISLAVPYDTLSY